MKSRNLLLDCDAGIDDAMVMFSALSSDKAVFQNIVCTQGNFGVKTCVSATNLFMAGARARDMQIGAGKTVNNRYGYAPGVCRGHGSGFPACLEHPASSFGDNGCCDALDIYSSFVKSYRRGTILVTGPLTNLDHFMLNTTHYPCGEIWISGGVLDRTLLDRGTEEFNLSFDPKASDRVLQSGIDVKVVPLDTTSRLKFIKADYGRLEERVFKSGTPFALLLKKLWDYRFLRTKEMRGSDYIYMHDLAAFFCWENNCDTRKRKIFFKDKNKTVSVSAQAVTETDPNQIKDIFLERMEALNEAQSFF